MLTKFAKRLKEVRLDLDFSQLEIASILHITQPSYFNLESGKTKPSYNTIYLLHSKLNISLDWLFSGTGTMYVFKQNNKESLDSALDHLIKDVKIIKNIIQNQREDK